MAKVITFSRHFPTHHTRYGQSTFFVEQIWNGLIHLGLPVPRKKSFSLEFLWSILPLSNYGSKYHTIRAGKRWKKGDLFSPRVWSGKAYRTKQIIIAPDIEIKKVWDISIERKDIGEVPRLCIWIDGKIWCYIGFSTSERVFQLCNNDGLTVSDFAAWFNIKPGKTFIGQIICWNENINY